jgi:tRNA U34 5-methylaminomethyl-2-thiouridine-forming methyltransferase MnmC
MTRNSSELKIISTKDGSKSIQSNEYNSSYHSHFGAITESKHVFIENGLKYKSRNKKNIKVLELGFGSGLNALLVWDYIIKHQDLLVDYYSIEKKPIPAFIYEELGYDTLLHQLTEQPTRKIHSLPWNSEVRLEKNFTIKKIQADFLETDLETGYDLIFFDAFAPDCQPELWTLHVFSKLYNSLLPEGILVTYCAKGYVKRNMKSAGFSIQALPGPPGKREITRAEKIQA